MSVIKSLSRPMPALLLLLALAWSAAGLATTIAGMDIDKVMNDAELVFEGEVILHETRLNPASGLVNTHVTFAVHDVVKGDYPAELIELKFSGGVFEGQVAEISGLVIPGEGERGIYFVESTSRSLMNPLLGWSQGHFVIREVNGEARVSTIDDKPVMQVQPAAATPGLLRRARPVTDGSSGAAAGVMVGASGAAMEQALTVEQFKAQVLELIEP